MRRGYLLLTLSLTGLGAAVATPNRQDQQQQPTAEAIFKNIVSFKGEKASDVIPAMQFMCASLKVDCNYCHVEDKASDAVRAKTTTRAMIAMQRDINKKNFNGRNQVTCATCHAGHEQPINLPPVEGLNIRARRAQDVKPDEVLAAYGKAVGTASGHGPLGLKIQGTYEQKGVKSSLDATYEGAKCMFVLKDPKSTNRQGFNGTMGWFTTPAGIQPVPAMYLGEYLNQRAVYTGVDSLPKLTNPTGGTAKVDGKDFVVVTGQLADKTRVSLFFDKQTGLLGRTAFYYPTTLGTIPQFNDYSNYRRVGGIMIATTILNHSAEGDAVQHFRSIKVDDKIDATLFDVPKK